MNVELHIDELILHGLAPADRLVIGAAVEHALTQLLAERGVPPVLRQNGAVAQCDGGSFTVTATDGLEALGAQVARAIYEGFQA